MRYLKGVLNKRATPQSMPIPGSAQVANSAGGFSFAIDDFTRLTRFLILGTDGGSYYATERTLTRANADVVARCIAADGERTVKHIVAISDSGRAPKNDPAIFALAMAASLGDESTKKAALAAVPRVCRTGTHLLHFAQFVDGMRGWGRSLRAGVAAWYLAKNADALAYQTVKYQSRDGFSHRDVLRLAHPKAADPNVDSVLRWVVRGEVVPETPALIVAFEAAKKAETTEAIVELIVSNDLPREAIPTRWLSERAVWDALLPKMPVTALLRNLATLTRAGVFADPRAVAHVVRVLTDANRLKKGRVHPIAVLSALRTYQSGKGVKGNGTWTPVKAIVDALDRAFYLAFGGVDASGKRHLLALDVSGSMGMGTIAGIPNLTPRDASAAMALVTLATEPQTRTIAFADKLIGLDLTPKMRLDSAIRAVSGLPFGGTDCAQPMLWAKKHGEKVDVFVVYTDSETWCGNIHPVQALRAYRDWSGIAAKLIVVGLVANSFTIADPNDGGMLDVVGFDTTAPSVMSDFAR